MRYFERRPYPPGVQGRRRRRESDYSARLREKQRLRRQYDLGEKQLRQTVDEAARRDGRTGRRAARRPVVCAEQLVVEFYAR